MPIRTLIVDDEPPARAIIREYLAELSEIEVIGECANGREAVAEINRQKPDLVFLDIQMPAMNGFEVLQRLDYMPNIIFSTAYDQYALQAFEVNAVDYLLKPYSRARFMRAVERIIGRKDTSEEELDKLSRLLHETRATEAYAERIFVRVGQKIIPVNTSSILWVGAEGDYSALHVGEKSLLCSLGLGQLEHKLDPAKFARVHRSFIVNLTALKSLESDGEGGYFATLADGARVRVSRTYAPKIRGLIL